jgi:hypothetical protein
MSRMKNGFFPVFPVNIGNTSPENSSKHIFTAEIAEIRREKTLSKPLFFPAFLYDLCGIMFMKQD